MSKNENENPATTDNDRLERYGRWLMSIPRDDVEALNGTPEYVAFLQAFERLGDAHRLVVIRKNETSMCSNNGHNENRNGIRNGSINIGYSFLQHLAVDDVILRVFEFLGCEALVRTSTTCHRFRSLALRSAEQRTNDMVNSRILGSAMKMLRAKEEIDGVEPGLGPFVRIPTLGLRRRIEVCRAGDIEFNGVYFCTGSNENGFVFSKPRTPERRIDMNMLSHDIDSDELQERESSRLLRCIISKRFSDETILWYMSKEIIVPNSTGGVAELDEEFSFWARLLGSGDAPNEICVYPSATSILSHNGEPGWQALSHNITMTPPQLEILD
mmetsp:Transcript_9136/g.11265  ORF Transcript_9136/g.11265 Transcript_9136/m.11265 type:complete len:328 (+) Transcript_9136:70-1053(+)|eukprot:CAMPEP_0172497082 /NCGR_PEP_ID=MMETSP1066-20121228/94898_1 /TAXON_ID=671091 /ORGANISM="Coscinodiscus wailesii, Strain CCMP2513" /LENGTH=327 /DNA_ID=CAMNT_0013269661 /DNA_START=70 /DNA_END=1053 /DNA_ORIENTATION=-